MPRGELPAAYATALTGLPPRPRLAVVDASSGGDGVAHVGRLLHRALTDLYEYQVPLDELGPAGGDALRRAAFFSRTLFAQAAGRADWVMFNHAGIARVQRLIPAAVRRPYAVFLHGVEAWVPDLAPSRAVAARGAALRLANSAYTARRVTAAHPTLGPIEPCPLSLLPDSPTRIEEVDAALLSKVRPLSVAIVGRMSAVERYKGHDQLIEVWPTVVARFPDAQLVVVGRGDDAARLREKARRAGVEASVLFTGFVDDATLAALLPRCTAFAMPSSGEGFGLAYLEAMRAGLPCVGSTADAATDVIADDETGSLVDPANRGALAAALMRLLENPEFAKRMGAAGRRRFETMFTYERFRDRLGTLLTEARGLQPRVTERAHVPGA